MIIFWAFIRPRFFIPKDILRLQFYMKFPVWFGHNILCFDITGHKPVVDVEADEKGRKHDNAEKKKIQKELKIMTAYSFDIPIL